MVEGRGEFRLKAVTVSEWQAYTDIFKKTTSAEHRDTSTVMLAYDKQMEVVGADWRFPDGVNPSRPNDPVVHITYHEALEYCMCMGFMMPTPYQYADMVLKDERPKRVGFKEIGGADIYSVHGNVWDWTLSSIDDFAMCLGGSHLCNTTTCNGVDFKNKKIHSTNSTFSHVGFSVIIRK